MQSGSERSVRESVDALEDDERAAVLALWADELRRGWIPKRADLEAALHLVRSRRR